MRSKKPQMRANSSFSVPGVDHHLQAFADRRQPRLHHRLVGVDAVVEDARVPGDLLRLVAQEVGVVELRHSVLADRSDSA